MSDTAVEFWQHSLQIYPLTLVVPDVSERVADIVAEGLLEASLYWKQPGTATAIVVRGLMEAYRRTSLLVGYHRAEGESLVVSFLDGTVEGKSFKRWVRRI